MVLLCSESVSELLLTSSQYISSSMVHVPVSSELVSEFHLPSSYCNKYQQLAKSVENLGKTSNYSQDIKSYQPRNHKQRQDCQYSNAISADTINRSQIQTHLSKEVYFNPVEQMSNLMEDKTQSFAFNNCQVTFNMAGSSAGAVACSDK